MQKAAVRAVAHPKIIQAVTYALLKEDQLMGLISALVSHYDEKESSRVRRDENHFEPRWRV